MHPESDTFANVILAAIDCASATIPELVRATGKSRREVIKALAVLTAAGKVMQLSTTSNGRPGRPAKVYSAAHPAVSE